MQVEYGFDVYKDTWRSSTKADKLGYMEPDYVQVFLNKLGVHGEVIVDAFLSGCLPGNWMEIQKAVIGTNGVGPIMARSPLGEGRPWGAEFMNILYETSVPITPLDSFLGKCLSGKAVKNRKKAVVEKTMSMVGDLRNGSQYKMINLGSAYAQDVFELMDVHEHSGSLKVSNIDIDLSAIMCGEKIAREKGMENVSFMHGDMMKMHRRVSDAHLVWLIGMLCGLGHREAAFMSKQGKKYLAPGGVLFGACVTDKMVEKDLFVVFVLEEIIGWHLCYRRPDDVADLFDDAGFEYEGFFTEGHEELYCIGIGKA